MPIGIATIFAVTQLITGSTATLSPTPTDSLPAAVALAGLVEPPILVPDTTPAHGGRPRAIEHSNAYYTRLTIHRIGSYAMLPLFVGEYVLGQKLLTSTNRSSGLKTAHVIVAGGITTVFAVNTVTGAWNFWDARHDDNGRTLRTLHSVIMLASDAGFVWTAASAGGAKRSLTQARKHRTIAIGSISVSAVGAAMMWIWRR